MFGKASDSFSRLTPQAVAFLKQLKALHLPPVEQLPLAFARDSYEKLARYQGGVPFSVARTEDRFIATDTERRLPLRIYWPTLKQLPILLYFHGGGWSRGSLNTHDALCRRIAKVSDCIVVSVDYRLAPEHPYPAAIEDAMAAYGWCQKNAGSLGGDGRRIAIGGDSAGGTISTSLSSQLAEMGIALPDFQLLIYPSLDLTFSQASVQQYSDGFFLTKSALDYYAKNYGKDQSLKDWRVSPLFYEHFAKLPPTIILTAECDPIRDDGVVYAKKLQAAGGKVASKNIGINTASKNT